jgi:alpha-mannosidase
MDHETSRNLAGPRDGWGPEARVNAGMLNRLQILWEQPHSMSAWNIGDIARVDNLIAGAEVKVIEAGPVRAAVEVRRRFLNSAMTQRIVLYRGLRRIDFETEVDWHERGSAHQDAPMLRATFAPFLGQTRATFEIPFAGLERPADGREVPAQRWADVSEVDYGVSLLNDGKYGHQAHGNTLGLTLVRASYEPDVNPDEGLHRFTYSFYPHLGDWRAAGTIRRAAEFNQPALVTVTDGHAGPLRPGQPWLRCAPENVQVSAIKLAEDQPAAGKTIIVRLYETHGRPANAVLRLSSELAPSTGSGQALNAVKGQALRLDPGQGWPILRAEEVDLIERPAGELPAKPVGAVPRACPAVEKGKIRLALGAHEIKTVKLYMA